MPTPTEESVVGSQLPCHSCGGKGLSDYESESVPKRTLFGETEGVAPVLVGLNGTNVD